MDRKSGEAKSKRTVSPPRAASLQSVTTTNKGAIAYLTIRSLLGHVVIRFSEAAVAAPQ